MAIFFQFAKSHYPQTAVTLWYITCVPINASIIALAKEIQLQYRSRVTAQHSRVAHEYAHMHTHTQCTRESQSQLETVRDFLVSLLQNKNYRVIRINFGNAQVFDSHRTHACARSRVLCTRVYIRTHTRFESLASGHARTDKLLVSGSVLYLP